MRLHRLEGERHRVGVERAGGCGAEENGECSPQGITAGPPPGYPQSLHAVTLSGRHRTLLRLAHSLVLADVSRDGRVLVLYENRRREARGRLEGDATERDLSWFDRTTAVKLMADGRTAVFGEEGEAGGPLGATYLWRVGSAPPARLSEGLPLRVSAIAPPGLDTATGRGIDVMRRHRS